MLPKDQLTTKSSRFDSSNRIEGTFTPVQFVRGVGPKLGSIFESRGIKTVQDLMFFFPRAYEDRSKSVAISDLQEGIKQTVKVRISSAKRIPLRRQRRTMFEARAEDESGESIRFKWFHSPRGIENQLKAGVELTASGTVKSFMGNKEMIHPELSFQPGRFAGEDYNTGRIVPIYSELDGIPTRTFRKVLWNAMQQYGNTILEDLPEWIVQKHELPSLQCSLSKIHFPEGDVSQHLEFASSYHHRVIYEEFFKFEILVLLQRLNLRKESARFLSLTRSAAIVEKQIEKLPFTLTSAQNKAIESILKEISDERPMNRLIQGDVGSGKTVVCFLSALAALEQNFQVCLMAPTEILAEQHFHNALKLFGTDFNVALLTGKTPQKERDRLNQRIQSGEALFLIGTHALIEDPVQFKELILVMIDEQHRFGVNQRKKLREKGGRKAPHTLVLTATPIPRTLSLTVYGDLSVTSIRELPPGRKPIESFFVKGKRSTRQAYQRIHDELSKGRQAYFIFPLVNESEAEGFTDLKSAIQEKERLQEEVFPDFKVGLLHGQLNSKEKSKIMGQFKNNHIQILVSTTVVEVGVDVPNATIMTIEHSDRFGLSQLHQLRGRVGRGEHQSYCFLMASERISETATERLKVMEKTQNGFEIAEADLRIRGPGEFLGTRQSGALPFKVGDILRDQAWLSRARDDATDILKNDPDFKKISNIPLRNYFEREGKNKLHQLMTS